MTHDSWVESHSADSPSSFERTRPITSSQTSTHLRCWLDSCVIVIPIFRWTPWCKRNRPRFLSGPCSTFVGWTFCPSHFRFKVSTGSTVCITVPGTGLYSPDTSSSSISHQTSKSYLECVCPDEAISFGLGEYKELIGTGLDKAGRKEIEGFGSLIRDEKFGIVELFECP